MTDRVTVSADRTKLLPPKSPHKGYRITRAEAADLGLLDSPEKPVQTRRVAPEIHTTVSEVVREAAKLKQRRRSSKRK